ncbi:MAG TPA: hypothetical protein VJ725_21510 [Thermoanaerobaculia bacterium]|nr:hypothetical protein [Thermoanaerobaculia bacterium]
MRRTMETRTLTVQLNDEQVESRSRQLARKSIDLAELEKSIEAKAEVHKSVMKELKDRVKEEKGELRALAEAVSKRAIRTDVDCDWRYYLGEGETGIKILVRRDTGEAVDRRPLTQEERQLFIGEKLEEANAAQVALWEQQLANQGVGEATDIPEGAEPVDEGDGAE